VVVVWDDWGGYYDHVPPPAVIAPDDIPPNLPPGSLPGGYDRYGFRVPAVIVSPYARRNYVSQTVRDHTAILKFIERKWNLEGRLRRGFPKYHVAGHQVTRRQYVKATAVDPSLPPFRKKEIHPRRKFPRVVAKHLGPPPGR